MKLFALYTDKNQWQLDEFLEPSIPKAFDFSSRKSDKTEYRKIIYDKYDFLLSSVRQNVGNYICWIDCDIQFFRDDIIDLIYDRIEQFPNNHLFYQHEIGGQPCTGFQVIKCCELTLKFYEKVLGDIKAVSPHKGLVDQPIIQKKIRRNEFKELKHYIFEDHVIWNPRRSDNRLYNPTMKIDVPKDIFVHHANWTREHKREQLERVKKIVENFSKNP